MQKETNEEIDNQEMIEFKVVFKEYAVKDWICNLEKRKCVTLNEVLNYT